MAHTSLHLALTPVRPSPPSRPAPSLRPLRLAGPHLPALLAALMLGTASLTVAAMPPDGARPAARPVLPAASPATDGGPAGNAQATPAPAPIPATGALPAARADGDEIIHVVQPGETLLGLSRTLLDTPARWRDVQQLNQVGRPRRLQPGTPLRIRKAWLKPEAVSATLATASNQVAVDGKPAQGGHAVKEGATIKTGPDSTAVITLPDGTTLRIPSATEVRLERLRAYHGEKDLDASILLRRGTIEPDSSGKRSRPLNIRTPAGNAAVRGTHFRVQAEARQSTVEVLRGKVAAGNRRGTADVDAGHGARVTPNRKPVVVPLPPAPDLSHLDGQVVRQVRSRIALPPLARNMVGYQVAVSPRPDFTEVLLDTRVRHPWFELASRQDGPHYVRVRQVSRQSVAGYDTVARLEVAARPLPPRLQALPATIMASGPVRLAWQDGDAPASAAAPSSRHGKRGTTEARKPSRETADGSTATPAGRRYRLQVASDAGFRQVLHDVIVPATQTELHLSTATPLGRWWRVAGIDGPRQGPFSAAQHFSLSVPAPIRRSQPRPAVKSADHEPVRTGSGDFLLLGR
ncbi:MAG: FecR domain-containing protein [Lautropia sp.]|nr:FecR domain-containing protein [Lautropia sp.]